MPTTPPSPVSRYVPALTGLRAVAAYLVFVHHYNGAAPGSMAYRVLAQGYVGVSVFFVLSGFLIYHRYADAGLTQANSFWRAYAQNRLARIVPLYACLLLLTAGVDGVLGRPLSWPVFGLNLTLLKGFFDEYKFTGIAQSWSLTVESCFYGVAPLLFVGLRRGKAGWMTAGLTGTGLLLWATIGRLGVHGLFGSLPFVSFYTFFGRAFEFVAGMWLARRWHTNQLPEVRFATAAGLVLMGVCVGWQVGLTGQTVDTDSRLWSEIMVYTYALPVGITLFIVGLIREPTFVSRGLARPATQALGRSSYAFYLIHVGVVAKGFDKTGAGSNRWLLFGLLVLVAHGLYRFVEKPLQRRLRFSGLGSADKTLARLGE